MATTEQVGSGWRRNDFRFFALADKILTPKGIRYLLFFEDDVPYKGTEWIPDCGYKVFPTRNGFHAIGVATGTAVTKDAWFRLWKLTYPDTDYRLQNLNWLAPHSREEFDFIEIVKGKASQLQCDYYRDKSVFETFNDDRRRR